MSDSDIGKTLPFAQITTASFVPAASSASRTAGSSFDCGVGRNWLSITIATDLPPAISSEKRGPSTGDSSASARRGGRVRHVLRLVGVDRGQQVRVGDVQLELVPVDLRLVVGRADRERV